MLLSFILVVLVHGFFGQGAVLLKETEEPAVEVGNWRTNFPRLTPDDPVAEQIDQILDSRQEYFEIRAHILQTHYGSWVGYCKGKGIGPSSPSLEVTLAQRDSWIKEHKDWENCAFYFTRVGLEEPREYIHLLLDREHTGFSANHRSSNTLPYSPTWIIQATFSVSSCRSRTYRLIFSTGYGLIYFILTFG